ncbi:MAG: NAD(P)H-dependent flavin oxidoreductase [Flavisolibacter sp.]
MHNTKPEILHTDLCDLLGIKYPIIQSGMGSVATPELAAKVSEAGGLGIIGAALISTDELRNRIKRIRELTKKPFGVNLLLHEGIVHPIDIHKIPEAQTKEVQKVLNKFRDELNIPEKHGEPEELPETVNAAFEVLLEEKVPVWSIGLGKPTTEQVKRCHDKGIKIIAMIATVENAIEVAMTGVDVIIAQGSEAGGHRSTWLKRSSNEDACIGSMALIPQVVDAVKQPVVAAGGITDGRGLTAALALGASGVLIGTRFVATKESGAPDFHKQAILKTSSDNTRVTDKFSGSYARAIRNSFIDRYEKETTAVLPPWVHYLTAEDIYLAARKNNKPEYYTLWAGQGAAHIKNIPGADEVVLSMVNEAIENIQKLMQHR